MVKKKSRLYISQWLARKKIQGHVDFDYLNKLSEEELDWLNDFCREYYSAHFKKNGENLHKTDEEKRELYGANNSRDRDMFTKFDRVDISNIDTFFKGDGEDDK